VVERFEVQSFSAFLMADQSKALYHISSDELRRKPSEVIRRCEGQPCSFSGVQSDMATTKDVDVLHNGLHSREQMVTASLVGLEDAPRRCLFRPFRFQEVLDALLYSETLGPSQTKQDR